MIQMREPALHQRTDCRQREERQTDYDGEQAEAAENRPRLQRGEPRRKLKQQLVAEDAGETQGRRRRQQEQLQPRLPAQAVKAMDEIGVEIAGQQRRLEEY